MACSEPIRQADLIFCFAGREHRKRDALALFSQAYAPQILISVGRYEIRRFENLSTPFQNQLLEMAACVTPPERHFFVWFGPVESGVELVRTGALGSLSEILALRKWLAKHQEIKRVLLVSSRLHLRRLRACCRILPHSVEVRLIASSGSESARTANAWWRDRLTRDIVLSELLKISLYQVVLALKGNYLSNRPLLAELRRSNALDRETGV